MSQIPSIISDFYAASDAARLVARTDRRARDLTPHSGNVLF